MLGSKTKQKVYEVPILEWWFLGCARLAVKGQEISKAIGIIFISSKKRGNSF